MNPTRQPSVFGIDIGGANIKLSRADGDSVAASFPMWTDFRRLGNTVAELLSHLGTSFLGDDIMAVTMTGELADCFFSRREGVAAILDGLTSVIPESQCKVYAVGGQWLSVHEAKSAAWDVAASNWHALVSWLLTQSNWDVHSHDVVLDIGSTTVDIIPIAAGQIATAAKTDRQRMQLGQLVYSGMERTPVHAIVQDLVVDGQTCPVMAERFATIIDVHLVLGTLAEQPTNSDTADGRPRTRRCALARLARMVGEDSESLSESEIALLAQQVLDAQTNQVARALARNLYESSSSNDGPKRVFVTGHGKALVDSLKKHSQLAKVEFTMLESLLTAAAARCAPALAVAQLWQQAR